MPLCDEATWKSIKCEGCELNWPSQRDHLCASFWSREEDAWLYYYDKAIQVVDPKNVWNLAQEVAYMLEMSIPHDVIILQDFINFQEQQSTYIFIKSTALPITVTHE